MSKRLDLTTKKYGTLTPVKPGPNHRQASGKTVTTWLCKCDCGNTVTILTLNLRHIQQSCGSSCPLNPNTLNSEHLTRHPLYSVWLGMKRRCSNKKETYYHRYGGRGIRVCNEWRHNFKEFLSWAENNNWTPNNRLQIDRKDNDGDYHPDNCRWVTCQQNSANKGFSTKNTSGYTGVIRRKRDGKWIAQIMVHKKCIRLGQFNKKEAAAKARNDYIIREGLQDFYKVQEIEECAAND